MSWSQRLMPFVKLLANSMSSQVIVGIVQSGNGGSGFGCREEGRLRLLLLAWCSRLG